MQPQKSQKYTEQGRIASVLSVSFCVFLWIDCILRDTFVCLVLFQSRYTSCKGIG